MAGVVVTMRPCRVSGSILRFLFLPRGATYEIDQ